MTKAFLTALRELPEEYVRDGTQACEYGPKPGCVFAVHSELLPICYYPDLGEWKTVTFTDLKNL